MKEKIYFLGAGASREAGVPTQKEIWEQVEGKWEKTGDPRIRQLLDFAVYLNLGKKGEKVSIDIAEYLTIIDLALEQRVSLGIYHGDTLREIRENLVGIMCEILDRSVNPDKYGVFEKFCACLSDYDTIISLNYDTVIDNIISYYLGQVVYGFPFSENLGDRNLIKNGQGQLLLKPHGSLNWQYCSRCNNIYLLSGRRKDCLSSWPVKCPADEHPLYEVVITPSYHKQFLVPQLHDVWMHCFHKIKNADIIYFIGYSFPPGDIHIIHLLKRAILAGVKRPEINVINRDSQGTVFDRCQNIFAHYNYYRTSFREYFCDNI